MAQVLLLDSISTGLDSATTFQIIKALRDFCHLREVGVGGRSFCCMCAEQMSTYCRHLMQLHVSVWQLDIECACMRVRISQCPR